MACVECNVNDVDARLPTRSRQRDEEPLDPRPSDAFREAKIVAEQERGSIEQLVDRREPVDEKSASLLRLRVGRRPQQIVVRGLHVVPTRQEALYPLEVVRRARIQLRTADVLSDVPRHDGTFDDELLTVFQQRDEGGAGAHPLVLFNKFRRLGLEVDDAVIELDILF